MEGEAKQHREVEMKAAAAPLIAKLENSHRQIGIGRDRSRRSSPNKTA